MIATKCPGCGAEGRVASTKVNTRLVCPKCLKVFHVTSSGRSTLGEPPTPSAAAAPEKSSHHAADQVQRVDEFFQDLSESVFTRKSLTIAGCVLAVGLIAAFFSLRKGETLTDQAEKVTRAVMQGDLQTLRNLSATGTAQDAVAWYESVRPICDEVRPYLASHKLIIAVLVTQEDKRQGTADVLATTFLGEEILERRGSALPDATIKVPSSVSVSLSMGFRSEGWSGWRFDGRRTATMPTTQPGKPAVPGTPAQKGAEPGSTANSGI